MKETIKKIPIALKKHIVAYNIFIVQFLIILIVVTVAISNNIHYKDSISKSYTLACKEAQESLYEYLNTNEDASYTYMISHIGAMIDISHMADENSTISHLNNDLIICHTYLVEAPNESKMYIDFLNEALMMYLEDGNIEGALIRLKAFNNRVYQETH